MGSEPKIEGSAAGKRETQRARVLLSAKLTLPNGEEVDARLRDLSRKGALVEAHVIPPVGSEVVFARGGTVVPARVAWTGGNRVGLEFAFMIDEHEVLVQLGVPRKPAPQNFRRPPIASPLTAQERKLAHAWGSNVGIVVPD